MIRFLLCAVLSLMMSTAFAHELTPQEALSNALSRLNAGVSAAKGVSQQSMTLSYTESADSESPLFYVFNKADGGFLIAGADSRSTGLLGYTDNGSFDEAKTNPAFKAWLSNCTAALQWLSKQADTGVSAEVTTLSNYVRPLLQTKWYQEHPYDYQCPTYLDNQGKTVYCATGCTATATAQVMYFHHWPAKGTGSHTNKNGKATDPNYTVNFGESQYAWSSMSTTYTGSEAKTDPSAVAVSKLMSDVGNAISATYGDQTYASLDSAYTALLKYFGYDKSAFFANRDYYTTADWNNLLMGELDKNRPVLMSAADYETGHAFVLDGYDTNGLYHVNWGWSGKDNGYFDINYMVSAVQGVAGGNVNKGYNMLQHAIIGLTKDDSGTSTGSPFLVADNQIKYDAATREFSFSFKNNGGAAFTGDIAFVITDAAGNFVYSSNPKSYASIPVLSTEGYSLTYTIPSGVTIKDNYVMNPCYRMSSSDNWERFPAPLSAEDRLIAYYQDGTLGWGYNYLNYMPVLSASNFKVVRNYTGYAPKFSFTVTNSSTTQIEYNKPFCVYVSKNVNGKKVIYCFGIAQAYLKPGESADIEIECIREGVVKDASKGINYTYKDMTDGNYIYDVCYYVGSDADKVLLQDNKQLTGEIYFSTPADPNLTLVANPSVPKTVKRGDILTVTFPIKNEGGFTTKDFAYAILDKDGNNCGQVISSGVDMFPNVTTTVSLSHTADFEPGTYFCRIMHKQNGDWKELLVKNDIEFTVTEATAIREVSASSSDSADAIFDISGRRVKDMQKGGIYIINGKKVVR